MLRTPVWLACAAVIAAACAPAPTPPAGTATARASIPATVTSSSPAPPTAPAPAADAAAPPPSPTATPTPRVITGAAALAASDFGPLHGRRVGLIANQTSVAGGRHLIDLLHEASDVDLVAVYAPEHGVRGAAGAGEDVGDTVDEATGVPVISLYKTGSDFRPTQAELAGVDVLVYDLQDVGARFYTFISTMGRSMEAAAEAGIGFLVLDRPNPSGGLTVEGFTRTADQVSFISEYPIPSRYGLTAGELARMIAGEGWKTTGGLDVQVAPLTGWARQQRWGDTGLEWIPPSRGLPTPTAALVYPGTVLIEATSLSYGLGTQQPFTQVGAPWVDADAVTADLTARQLPGVAFAATRFVPEVIPGLAENPDAIRFLDEEVAAVRIEVTDPAAVASVATGVHLLDAFRAHAAAQGRDELINRPQTFDLLAGTSRLRLMLQEGASAGDVVAAWADDVAAFERQRAPYLQY